MATNNKIAVSELDFDGIKNNLKTYLRGQSELSDYNFDGSGLSLLLDILAYNTHYNALYTNLAINESWLDSAVKRDSIVSRAFELGYTPRSARASTAVINVIATGVNDNPTSLILAKNTMFRTSLNNKQYTFYSTHASTAIRIGNKYTFSNVEIKEGTPLKETYVVNTGTRVLISNKNCDTTTIAVTVRDTLSSTSETVYTQVEDILSVKASDPVYFIKEIEGKKYELQFGNGRIGKALQNGNVVTIAYMVTNKDVANGARAFKYESGGLYANSVSVETRTLSYGGAETESVESIKHSAPRMFSAVNRAVTIEDYKTIIQKHYPHIDAINVWSGAENHPPVYGKVFIAIKPSNETVLSPNAKNIIKSEILKSRNLVTITPEFVDPFYLNIALDTTIYYDPKLTTKTNYELEALVKQSIASYNDSDLKQFDSAFRYSKLMNIIDSTDTSITSNITTVKIRRPVTVKYNTTARYNFHIDNPIYSAGVPEEAVTSTGFYVSGSNEVQYLIDDGYGVIKRYYLDLNNTKIYTNTNQGFVNYTTGEIILNDLTITSLAVSDFSLIIKPHSNDIISVREHIAQIDFNNVKISSVVDTISSGNSYGGTSYTFTPSR